MQREVVAVGCLERLPSDGSADMLAAQEPHDHVRPYIKNKRQRNVGYCHTNILENFWANQINCDGSALTVRRDAQ